MSEWNDETRQRLDELSKLRRAHAKNCPDRELKRELTADSDALDAALARIAELESRTAVFSMGDALRKERDELHRVHAQLAELERRIAEAVQAMEDHIAAFGKDSRVPYLLGILRDEDQSSGSANP